MARPLEHVLRMTGAQLEDVALAIAAEFTAHDPAAAHERLDSLALGLEGSGGLGGVERAEALLDELGAPSALRVRSRGGPESPAARPRDRAPARPSRRPGDRLRGGRSPGRARASPGRQRARRHARRPVGPADDRPRSHPALSPTAPLDRLALSARGRGGAARGALGALPSARRDRDRDPRGQARPRLALGAAAATAAPKPRPRAERHAQLIARRRRAGA